MMKEPVAIETGSGEDVWAIGIDLGGTKTEVAQVGGDGRLLRRLRLPTHAEKGPAYIKKDLVSAVQDLQRLTTSRPAGVGIGVAGQVDPLRGVVLFGPNLDWHNEPLQADLCKALGLPVIVTNDVRAATWGEWLYGAGQGCDDLVCVFVGTGIGGGVVSGGQMLSGCSNTAGEIGHIVINLGGPSCRCGSRGCFEALAGGLAFARRAREATAENPSEGAKLLHLAGGRREAVTAEIVVRAAREGDPFSCLLVDELAHALVAGAVSLVNAFNPCRLILGGGVIEGMPELLERIAQGVRKQALAAATGALEVLPARLKGDAAVIGAATLILRSVTEDAFFTE